MKNDHSVNLPADGGLKLCGACGALNHGQNCCCCNCGWQGHFDNNDDRVLDIIKQIEEDVDRIVSRELNDQFPWTKYISVRVKTLMFSVKKVEDCHHLQDSTRTSAD